MQDEWRPGLYYHIIGKAIPGELLFREERDYRRMLRKGFRDQYGLVFQIYVYCLLPNHFHLVVRTLYPDEITARLAGLQRGLRPHQRAYYEGRISWRDFVQASFAAATNGYAQYYNRRYGRRGQLFVKPTLHGLSTKDAAAPGEAFSRRLAAYVGLNYVKHGLAGAGEEYLWSSLRKPMYHFVELDIPLHWGTVAEYKAYHVAYLRRFGAQMLAFDEERFFAALTPRRYVEEEARWVIEEGKRGGGG